MKKRDITVDSDSVTDYGYLVRLPYEDWMEVGTFMEDEYILETARDYGDMLDELIDPRIGITLDPAQLSNLFDVLADLDLT